MDNSIVSLAAALKSTLRSPFLLRRTEGIAMKKSRSIHIVIADDHSIVREGIAAVVNREPDMKVVAQASNWPEAVQQVLQNRPEIAVLDLHMRGMEPANGVATLRKKLPTTQTNHIFCIRHR